MRRISPRHVVLTTGVLALAGCSSFSILTPASTSTVSSPVAADVFWNADLQPGTLAVIADPGPMATDVTNQFSFPSLSADGHATANLNLPQGSHTLRVTGNLWDPISRAFTATSASQSFVVANGLGRAVTYTQTVFNFPDGWPAGQLGNVSFGGTDPQAPNRNVNLIFRFDGNTNDVVAFFVPRPCTPNCTNHAVNDGSGFEIVAGTATITVQNAATGATIAQGTFLPGAGIFVSADNGNGGIGFGSLGALPTDPTFPDHGVEVAYPYALFAIPYTDLKSNMNATSIWALSCAGFNGSPGTRGPGTCNLPIGLATTAGILMITSNDMQDTAPAGQNGAAFATVVH